MKTPFDLIKSLESWFFSRAWDVVLADGKKLAVSGANIEISNGNLTITTGNITITGTVDGIDISAHAANSDAHHNQSHVLATSAGLGPDHTMSGASTGDVLRATSSTAARFDPLSHSDLTGVTANQHHNESHTVASHSDTTATGAELNTLTNGSDASSLHDHDGRYFQESEFTHQPSGASAPLESDGSGGIRPDYITVESGNAKIFGGLVVGNTSATPGTGRIVMKEATTPGTPSSGLAFLWFNTSGRLYYKNDSGTTYGPL